jgi:hypothetical protein
MLLDEYYTQLKEKKQQTAAAETVKAAGKKLQAF